MRQTLMPSLLAGLLGSLVLAAAAPAATSVSAVRACWAEGDPIQLDGSGFTPNGPVRLTLERDGRVLATSETARADAGGRVRGSYQVPEDTGWFEGLERRFEMTLRLVDTTRQREGMAVESTDVSASVRFPFSRWNILIRSGSGRLSPVAAASLSALGFTNAIGRTLYAHYVRQQGGRRTVRLGRVRGPCGDVTRRLRRGFPFRPVRAGSWRVYVNASRRSPRASGSVFTAVIRVGRTIRR